MMHTTLNLAAVAAAAAVAVGGCASGTEEPAVSSDVEAVQASELPCPKRVDADYPIEPTFDSPEEALADALKSDPIGVAGPEDVDDYHRVERSKDSLEFEFRDGGNVHHTWGVSRDGDGRWGVTSLGGCVPADF